MTVKYYLQSDSNPSSIYVRIREGSLVDAKANTNFLVNPDAFNKGEIKLFKIPPKASAEDKKIIQEKNDYLNELQSKLNTLKSYLISLLNNKKEYEIIDSKWLKEIIKPSKTDDELPITLVEYFEKYLDYKKKSLAESTYKRQKSIKARIEKFTKEKGRVYIQNINLKFSNEFQLWCDKVGYDVNTTKKTLQVIKTVCNHAYENGLVIHPDLNRIDKELKYKKSENITLSFEEIKRISAVDIEDIKVDVARDWLVISCYTAQRVSDFLRFSKENIVKIKGEELLDIRQKKTDKPIYLPILDEVKKILEKRNGEFPPLFSNNKDSNATIYNELIKQVCKLAEINEVVEVKLKDIKENRYKLKQVPKYRAVSTHIGRRSFATNFYGKINTALLIGATGHSTEAQFLRYVGKSGTQNALDLALAMKNIEL
jgi:integrase